MVSLRQATFCIFIVTFVHFKVVEAQTCRDSSLLIDCAKKASLCNNEEWIVVMNRLCAATCGFCSDTPTVTLASVAKTTSAKKRQTVPVVTMKTPNLVDDDTSDRALSPISSNQGNSSSTSSWIPSWIFNKFGMSPRTAVVASQNTDGTKQFGYFTF
uniref:ShKT domain-containing protein n=1 Tax=Panagrellus redivivus TaxID=6233 RepID=A0A7E4W4Y1_PANRE